MLWLNSTPRWARCGANATKPGQAMASRLPDGDEQNLQQLVNQSTRDPVQRRICERMLPLIAPTVWVIDGLRNGRRAAPSFASRPRSPTARGGRWLWTCSTPWPAGAWGRRSWWPTPPAASRRTCRPTAAPKAPGQPHHLPDPRCTPGHIEVLDGHLHHLPTTHFQQDTQNSEIKNDLTESY